MRNRWMYYATGLPGWMRFGYSPGWVGRSSSGLGPCATYMMTGAWPTPQMQAYWQGYAPTPPMPVYPPSYGWGDPAFAPGYTKEQELEMLKEEAEILNQQIEEIQNRIDKLEEDQDE
ncbi:hypothetical protein GF312_18355 [Candidatus Poribacteria bacterium]|nr:hypothetical protein [Candidatus Poribacteria bacterium]